MSELFYPLKIKRIVRETKDAASFVFDIPAELKEKYQYLPGQYLTLSTNINGSEVRRAYSFSSSPITDADPAVTIKKVKGGVFSTFMNDDAFEGQVLQVMPPMGNFVVHLDESAKKHYVLFAGGSGVTPIMSIAKSVLDKELNSCISMVYCNQDEASIIFNQTIKDMEMKHWDRFSIIHALDNPPMGWADRSGRQSAEDFANIAREVYKEGYDTQYYICGPSGMMDTVKTALQNLGIENEKIHTEYFTSPTSNEPKEEATTTVVDAGGDSGTPIVTISLNGKETDIEVEKGTTILDAAKEQDLDPPYACQIGVCTTCRAKLLEGEVEMDEREGLSDDEIKKGYILTCQSHPTTPKVKLIYE
jgi:ring-1,2-phenylacetyl-CoA epoxidase subunit PaaE